MRRSCRLACQAAFQIAVVASLGGCSGFGKFWHDTLTLPGANPNAPTGDAENLVRVRGGSSGLLPIIPQGGNVWPGAPRALPSLGDVEGNQGLAGQIGNPATFYGGAPLEGPQLQEGGSMSAGEQDGARHGVRDFSDDAPLGLPNHEQDNAASFGAKARTSTISIPNGDGTSTLIAPDGSVRVVKTGSQPSGH